MPTVTEILETMAYSTAVESDAEATAWIAAQGPLGPFIGGAFRATGMTAEVYDPMTGKVLATLGQAGEAEVTAAVAAGRAAQPGWAATPGRERAALLHAIARQIERRTEVLSMLASLETGIPVRACAADAALAARIFASTALRVAGLADSFPDHGPLGVTAAIIRRGAPLTTLARRIAPALAAGNALVVEARPGLSALALATLAVEAGLPEGLLNVLTGDTAEALARSGIAALAVTGPTALGQAMRRATAGADLRLTLELGASPPFIVFADADLDAAVEGVVAAAWADGGGIRILAAEAIAAPLTARLKARIGRLRGGDPRDRSTDFGAVPEGAVFTRQIARASAAGAHRLAAAPGVGPVLLAVQPANPIWAEDLTGPVALLTTFRTAAEAVDLANNSRFSQSASIWSEGITQSLAVAMRLNAGTIALNAVPEFDPNIAQEPAGDSGFGADGGRPGMAAQLRPLPPRAQPEAALGGLDAPAEPTPVPGPTLTALHNAVAAAQKAAAWSTTAAPARAGLLRTIAETLASRRADLSAPADEIEATLEIALRAATCAESQTGATIAAPGLLTVTLDSPRGVIGIACPDSQPLAAFAALVLPAIALGNRVVVLASPQATLAQALAASGLPAGVVNIVSGPRDPLALALAAHDDIDALWYCGTPEGRRAMEMASAENLLPVWAPFARDWTVPCEAEITDQSLRRRSLKIPCGL